MDSPGLPIISPTPTTPPPLTSNGDLTRHSQGFEAGNAKLKADLKALVEYAQGNPSDLVAVNQVQSLMLEHQAFRSLQTNTTKGLAESLKEVARNSGG